MALAGIIFGDGRRLDFGQFRPGAGSKADAASNAGAPQLPKRQALAMDFFMQRGWEPHQAAGIVGNLVQESGAGLESTAVGDDGTAHGIAQWRGERFQQLKDFAKERGTPWQNFQTQLEFVQHELETSESGAAERLRAAGDVAEATDAFLTFERPGLAKREKRLRFAQTALGSFEPAPPPSDLFDLEVGESMVLGRGGESRVAKLRKQLKEAERSEAFRETGRGISDALSGAAEQAVAGLGKVAKRSEAEFVEHRKKQRRVAAALDAAGPLPRLPTLGELFASRSWTQ